MNWRSPVLRVLLALVALLVVGVGAYYLGRSNPPVPSPTATPTRPPVAQSTSVPQASPTPTQSSLSPPSPEPELPVQWVAEATTPPNQPTPTAPPGVFFFKTAAGTVVANPTPAASSAPMNARTHEDTSHGYAIHYPAGWVQREGSVQGQQVLTFYPPGTNPSANVPGGAAGISFGWTAAAPSIDPHDSAYTDMGAVTVGGVRGHLFTIGGPMGYVATAVFPRGGGYVVVSVDAGSGTLLDTFRQMLASLKFT